MQCKQFNIIRAKNKFFIQKNLTAWPFLYQLGQTIYQYELQRKRKYAPDLQKFKMQYEKRDTNDTRPTIKNVDN